MKSKKITVDEVKHVAKLANLPLASDKVTALSAQFEETVNFVDSLQEVNIKNVPPTSQVTGTTNVFREDEIDPSRVLSQEDALKNASRTKNGYFVVPRIFD